MKRKIRNSVGLLATFLCLFLLISQNVFYDKIDNSHSISVMAVPNPNWEANSQYDYQFSKIKLKEAWDIETGSPSTIVGVIDTGINFNHTDLENKINSRLNYDFIAQRTDYDDKNGHGTHVAGIIGATANNSSGTAGVCWDVSLVSLRVGVNRDLILSKIIEAIQYATTNEIPILNMSLGTNEYCEELEESIRNYPGLIVCSAGNDGVNTDNIPHYPSCYEFDNIISVGASNAIDERGIFSPTQSSNYGKNTVDLFAPGVQVYSTLCQYNNGNYSFGYGAGSGTSMAAPFVTGVAALLLSQNPRLTAKQLKYRILNSVDEITDLRDLCVSGGRLNAYKALTFTHSHTEGSPKYFNSVYHEYSCGNCGEIRQEEHNWISNQPGYLGMDIIQPMYIPSYTCTICHRTVIGPVVTS